MKKTQPPIVINREQAARQFHKSFITLVAFAWTVPAAIGFSFFPVFEIYTPLQIKDIILTPLILGYMLGVFTFVLVYFHIYMRPVTAWIQCPEGKNEAIVQHRLKRFPVHFWILFMAYDMAGGTVTIVSGEIYGIHSLAPIEIFRVYMIAMIAAIIPGLPIFFKMYDLFGRSLGDCLRLHRPLLTIKTRVFLIGALIPLLIDSILVQYYWTRTGYFGWDTFIIWIALEVLAIAGTLLFLRGFSQSLSPLHGLLIQNNDVNNDYRDGFKKPAPLIAASTDELGFISAKLDDLLNDLHQQHEKLDENSQQIQEREQYLSLILNSIGDAVIVTDGEGKITHMNPVAEQLTGWSFDESQGLNVKSIFPIIDASTRQPMDNPVEKVLANGETVYLSNHTTLIAKDNTEYQIADSAAPIRDENDIIQGMVLVFNDVTEQYQLREAAAKSKRDMQGIMDFTPAVIYAKDIDGRYIFINQKFETLFHVNSADVIGKTDHDIFPADFAAKFQANDNAVLAAGHALESEEEVPQDNGLHRYISVKFPLFDDNAKAYAVCGISTDITERATMEEALRRSQKMEAIGQLSGGIAHDFNNQLGVVIGYLDFLQNYTVNDEKPHKWVDTASRATMRCMALTRQLLTFSRRQGKEKSVVNLNTTLNELKTIIQRSVTPEVEVQYFLADNLQLVETNPGELEDSILNLVINARDAMPSGGKLLIETSNKTLGADYAALNSEIEAGDYVQLMLSDTGTGMDKKTLEHIFEPFFTTKPEGKGTGLGMAMVYGFVKRYNGNIKIYSESDVGTTIRLYLPSSTASESTVITNNNQQTKLPTGNESILIVDDEVDLLQLASQYLSDLGYRTRTAENATQALKILAQDKKFDVLFSDVVMPGDMNGYELAQQATLQQANLKVLLTSGFTSKTAADSDLAHFATHLLSKPYRKEDLAQRIRFVLDEDLEA
jgi:PAS domain S-box-containing protein